MNKEIVAENYNLDLTDNYDIMVINALIAINKHNMNEWIINFNEPTGFMWSTHKNISILVY